MKNLITCLVVCVLSGATLADILTVDDDGIDYPKADFDNIQEALNTASDGDTINVYPGTYTRFTINTQVSLIGVAGPEETIVDGAWSDYVFINDADSYVEGFTFTKGSDSTESADSSVLIYEAIVMKNCVINQCRPTNGFPLKVHDSSTFEDVVVEGNYDEYAYTPTGACIQIDFEATNTTFRRCTIRNNFAHRWEGNIDGGGILNRATNLRLEECVIANNRITTKDSTDLRYANGSAIWSNYPFYMDNTIICGNIGLYSNGAQGSQIYGAYAGTGNVVNTNCDSTGSVAGACCLETECTLATAYDCGVAGGNFKGMLTTCEQVDCMDDGNYGACCVDGNCASSTQHVCDSLGGEWQGKFTTCENVACTPPPAIAACCLSDDCITTVETLCQTLGGTWQGDSSDCKSATCDPWVGACCVSGSCLEVTLAACYEAEGSYSGDLTVCASTECTDDYCYGDLNGDGVVNVTDVLGIMAAWGACP